VEPVCDRRSEPINKKFTVSCPLLRIWLSNVGCGAMVLLRITASMVGSGVGVSEGREEVGRVESTALVKRSGSFAGMKKLVAPMGRGWKGVGVADGFGAAVTNSNRLDGAGDDAGVAQPASRSAARINCRRKLMAKGTL
jgi:hypothetical protein